MERLMAVREFLYVDVERSRSMLAQLDGGVVEAVVERNKTAMKGGAAAKFFGIGISGDASRERGWDESRSLQDLTYVLFEEAATDEELVLNAPDIVRSPEAWESGAVHRALREAEIIKLKCDVQILDPAFFRARLDRFNTFVRGIAEINVGNPSNLSRGQREKRVQDYIRDLFNGAETGIVERVVQAALPLFGDSIAVRAMPCGPEQSEFSFGGVLLGRVGYIQQEREDLFSRHGTLLRDWTIVMQLATVPEKPNSSSPPPKLQTQSLVTDSNQIKRAAFEQMASQLLGMLDSTGISEGPRWPSVTATPLAIYRSIPQSDGRTG
jgi:hypothetical protein